jgi:hypothetical protein
MWPDEVIGGTRGSLRVLLDDQLEKLAALLDCEVKDLRLDHDPALATRVRWKSGKKTLYSPDANSPDHLIYREKHDHHIKTNVRGEHGQHPDRVLIKRERRRQKKEDAPHFRSPFNKSEQKRKWASRPFPKGRKIANRRKP